jgi:RND family efflux transporter MFP subunit
MDTERARLDLSTEKGMRCCERQRQIGVESTFAALALLALFAGCAAEPAARRPPSVPAVGVRVVTADRSQQPILTEVVGTVRSVREATIAALVSGTVTEIRVGVGSVVRAGEVLVRLSARELDAVREQARAVSAGARQDRDRAITLKAQDAITAAQYDAAVSQWNVAEAREAEAIAVVDRTVLRAPFAAVVTAKRVDLGETALPGRALLTLESRAANRFEAQVPESASAELAIGQRLPVRIAGLGPELEGRIAEIHPSADDATRARVVKLDLPPTAGLRPGQFGRLLVATERAVSVTVPAEAIVRRGQLETLFVVESGVARLRLVRSGRQREGRVQICAGLTGGEKVAMAAMALVDGQRVQELP